MFEDYYISNYYHSQNFRNGFNLRAGGSRGKHSFFTKSILRKKSLGKKHTPETKRKIGETCKRKNLSSYLNSEKARINRKQSWLKNKANHKTTKGIPCSEETKQKLRQANLGKKASQETREKLSKIHKGNVYGFKKGQKGYWAGKRLSKEHRQKLSAKK